MIEKNCTITVTELVVYQNSLLSAIHDVHIPLFEKVKTLFEYVVKFDTTLKTLKFSARKKFLANKKHLKKSQNVYQPKLAIYSVTDAMATDIKKVSDIMKIYN